jgi:hypothetical protein
MHCHYVPALEQGDKEIGAFGKIHLIVEQTKLFSGSQIKSQFQRVLIKESRNEYYFWSAQK